MGRRLLMLTLIASISGNASAKDLGPFAICGRIASPVSNFVAAIGAFESGDGKATRNRLKEPSRLMADIWICTDGSKCEVIYVAPGDQLLSIQWISPFDLAVRTRTLGNNGLQTILSFSIIDRNKSYRTKFLISEIDSYNRNNNYLSENIIFDRNKCNTKFKPLEFIKQ